MSSQRPDATQILLAMEEEARLAQTPEALQFVIVNETRRLVAYDQAVLLLHQGERHYKALTAAGVPVLDRDAPFVSWIERVAGQFDRQDGAWKPHPVTSAELPDALARDWADFGAPAVWWQPLVAPDGDLIGALWLARKYPWGEAEQVLVGHLAGAYSHAWQALLSRYRRRRAKATPRRRMVVGGAVLSALIALAWPVPQTVMAPGEIVAARPVVVAAPIEGVIEAFSVLPEETVAPGQILFSFEDTPLRNRLHLAERQLGVAQAELDQAGRGAFDRAQEKEKIDLLEARVKLRIAERDYAQELLDQVHVRAERGGVVVFSDPQDWIGRPVRVGERVMSIADPADVALRVDVPVGDAITLEQGAPVRFFLNVNPLAPLDARLERASYKAHEAPGGQMAYRVQATFWGNAAPPRIGLQGTARVQGSDVPLAWVILRRPISTLRQWIGL